MRIGIVGGTGKEGRGMAARWARAGHTIAIGSRDVEKARAQAADLTAAGCTGVVGGDNRWAVTLSEVVLLSVPYAAHSETLRGLKDVLAGRVLIDITVPLQPPRVTVVHLPKGKSAALEAQEILGPDTKIVAALQHVSSTHLADAEHAIDCDVLCCSDDDSARNLAMSLIADLGLRALDAGPLANSVALESLTPVLLYLGKRYKAAGVGVRFTGLK